MSQTFKIMLDDQTVSIQSPEPALTPASRASLLAALMAMNVYQEPFTLGLVVGRELHSVPARHGLVVRLLAGIICGLSERPLERMDARNETDIWLAKRLTEAVKCGGFHRRGLNMKGANEQKL